MRYSLALYCSDLTDSTKDFIPVGMLVVDEQAQEYSFLGVSSLRTLDFMTVILWRSIPAFLEKKFIEYAKEPNHLFYMERADKYHGFISQVIQDCAQSTICFSDSILIEEDEGIERLAQRLFQEKVLRKLD